MAKVAKKILVTVPGIGRVESLPGGTFNPGGRSFQPVTTETSNVHRTEEDNPATASFRVPNLTGYLEAFRELEDANVNIQDESGQSWIMAEAFITNAPGVSNGEINIEMASG
ncbi:MAG: phage tail tube protein, partial [Neptuniibacter sp.]